MSPRWGLGVLVYSMCYKHVAPLGLNTTLLCAWVNTHHVSCPALINRDSSDLSKSSPMESGQAEREKQLERTLKASNLNRKPLGV